MKVLTVCPQYHPIIGGYETLAHTMARSLRAAGVDCTVVTRRLRREWPATELYDTVRVTRLPAIPRRGLDGPVWLTTLTAFLLRHRHAIDVVHVHQLGWGIVAAALFGRLTGTPVVAHPHSGSGAMVAKVRASRKRGLLERSLAAADAAVALSDEMADQLVALGFPRARIRRIANAVDVERFRPAPRVPELGAPQVVAVGRLSPEKGQDVLLRAWPQVLRAHPGAALTLIGDGPERPRLEDLRCELKITSSVKMPGAVSEGIEQVYQQADLFVLPSHREGVSMALLEAMACGLPVVATDLPSTAAVVAGSPSARLVAPGDPKALAQMIAGALADGLAPPRADVRAAVVAQYALPAVTAQYVAMYRQLVERRTGRPAAGFSGT